MKKNLIGIGALMHDLQSLDPNLYQKLQPQYAALLKRNRDAKIILWGGTGVGMALITTALLSGINSRPTATTATALTTRSTNRPKIPWELAAGGLLISSVSAIVYSRKIVKFQDILNFTNDFNQYSEGEKIEWSLRPVLQFGSQSSAGLSIAITF